MDLLELSRGPAMQWAVAIMVGGLLWRLVGVLMLRQKADYSEARHSDTYRGAVALIVGRFWPRREFVSRTAFHTTLAYVFHVGFLVVLLGYRPHVLFFKDIFGFSWPALPSGLIFFAGALTAGALIALAIRRLTHPVLRLLSNFDDWFSWLVTIAPVATGLAAFAHLGARYETLLGLHIVTVEVLMIWLPFGKLMHIFLAFVSRGTTGALLYRKGAAL